jgi:hypothetical protein
LGWCYRAYPFSLFFYEILPHPQDKQFFIKIAKSVDGIKARQTMTETRLTTLEHTRQALIRA